MTATREATGATTVAVLVAAVRATGAAVHAAVIMVVSKATEA